MVLCYCWSIDIIIFDWSIYRRSTICKSLRPLFWLVTLLFMNTVISVLLWTCRRLEILYIQHVCLLSSKVFLSSPRNNLFLEHIKYIIHFLTIDLDSRQALIHLFKLNNLMLMKEFPNNCFHFQRQLLQITIFHFEKLPHLFGKSCIRTSWCGSLSSRGIGRDKEKIAMIAIGVTPIHMNFFGDNNWDAVDYQETPRIHNRAKRIKII